MIYAWALIWDVAFSQNLSTKTLGTSVDRSRRQGRCRTGPVLHLPVRHAGDECSQLQHLRGKALPGELQGQACGLVLGTG